MIEIRFFFNNVPAFTRSWPQVPSVGDLVISGYGSEVKRGRIKDVVWLDDGEKLERVNVDLEPREPFETERPNFR